MQPPLPRFQSFGEVNCPEALTHLLPINSWAKLQTHKVVQIYKSFEKNHQILKMHSNCFIIQAVGSKYIHQLSIWQPRHNLP